VHHSGLVVILVHAENISLDTIIECACRNLDLVLGLADVVPEGIYLIICDREEVIGHEEGTDADDQADHRKRQEHSLKGYAGGAQYENVAIPADGATNYVLTVENDIAGFYKKDSGFKVYNHKAYLQVPAELQEVRKLNILFGDADNATGISNLLDMSHGSSTHVFDLQGRQVKSATHGVYIVNGKKLIK
jgi:hypothetical protein